MADSNRTAAWEPMKLELVGDVAEVLQKATGKLSIIASDSGIVEKKPPGN